MPGLVDIIALRETVFLGEVPITVRGISITTIGRCLAESDDLAKFWAQRKFDGASLLATLPRTIARLVATAIVPDTPSPASGFDDDGVPMEPVERHAYRQSTEDREAAITLNMAAFDELIAEHQLILVEAIIRVSFPGGLSPFGERLRRLAGLEPAAPGNGMLARFARFGRAQAGNSPPQ